MNDYRVIVQVEGGSGGSFGAGNGVSERKTVPSASRNLSALSVARNPLRATSSFMAGAKLTAGVAFAGMLTVKAIDEGSAISARLSGDHRGQIAWNNTKAELRAMLHPIDTTAKALTSYITEMKTNESVAINRELYGINDYRKGTK